MGVTSPFKTTSLIRAFLYLFSQQAVKDGDANPPLPQNLRLHSEWEKITGRKIGEKEAQVTRLAGYGRRFVKAVQDMPHNSPIRRSLLSIVAEDQPADLVVQDFGISLSTVYAARREHSSIALDMVYTPGVKRPRIDESRIDFAMAFLDEVIPVVSGRNFRKQTMTNENLYAFYFCRCLEKRKEPLSKSYFEGSILKNQNIQHSKDESVCDLCSELAALENSRTRLKEFEKDKLAKAKQHKASWYQQTGYYLKVKADMADEQDQDTALIIQDFSQLSVQGSYFQDLIVVAYFCDPEDPTTIKGQYNHFVASSPRVKNDSNFVFRTWLHLVESEFFNGFKKIVIFSDGGPKHFKTTATVTFFGVLQKRLGLPVEYHFFESNHGHSVCDTVAAHAKKALNVEQRDSRYAIKNTDEIVTVLEKVKNHYAEVALAQEQEESPEFVTFKGIRSMRKFTFDDDTVYGFKSSTDTECSHWWTMDTKYFDDFE